MKMHRLNLLCRSQISLRSVRMAYDDKALTQHVPDARKVTEKNAAFDQAAWDIADYRNARFEISQKQVNPNFAQTLIAEVPPIPSEERIVACDGGHPALGHPKVYINLDKPGNHACGYCGQRFYNTHVTKAEDSDKNHIQV